MLCFVTAVAGVLAEANADADTAPASPAPWIRPGPTADHKM